MSIEKKIKNILKQFADMQINLKSDSALNTISSAIAAAVESHYMPRPTSTSEVTDTMEMEDFES